MLESGQVVDSAMLPDGAVREHEVTVTAEDLIESIRVASQSPSQSSKALSLDSVSEGERSPTRQEPHQFTSIQYWCRMGKGFRQTCKVRQQYTFLPSCGTTTSLHSISPASYDEPRYLILPDLNVSLFCMWLWKLTVNRIFRHLVCYAAFVVRE